LGCQQSRVCGRDRFVFSKLFDQNMRFRCVATAENRSCGLVKKADLVVLLTSSSKMSTIMIVNQGKDTAADEDAPSSGMA
jgi:hypothetical protein